MRHVFLPLAALFAIVAASPSPVRAAGPLEELRSAFTVAGKPVPPEVFADFGDADLADSDPIVTTIDARAATGSNRYYDPIRTHGRWIIQTKADDKTLNGAQETAYEFIGKTANNLLVVVASWNGGGSGTFHTLHILDAAETLAFADDGKPVKRLALTLLRSVPLGDRWDGAVTIAGNTIHIATAAGGGGADGPPKTVEARRP